jgi:hypothetical protein
MNRTALLMMAATLAGATGLCAQTTNPVIGEMHRFYTQYKGFWTKIAASMPEESYGYKPTPEMRSVGELIAHVADHQTGYCSSVTGQRKTGDAASKKTKVDLMAALAASYVECDKAWDSLTDANANEMVGQRSKLGTLIIDVAHSEEEYGYMSVYFRLKGIVPPSSDRSGGR